MKCQNESLQGFFVYKINILENPLIRIFTLRLLMIHLDRESSILSIELYGNDTLHNEE